MLPPLRALGLTGRAKSRVRTGSGRLWAIDGGRRGSMDGEDGGELGMDITDGEMWDKWWEWECVKMRVAVLQYHWQ